MVESYRTSFFDLCTERGTDDSPGVTNIEIPLFQRDYAQGRISGSVSRIREDFLDVLHDAISRDGGESVGLDFVYGGVTRGTLQPLDGQQRLTTLFLLHWYLASRSGNLSTADNWTRFAYSTRESARMFCESLVTHALPDSVAPSAWIADQSWYLFVWRHDPSIQSMLVVLDGIDRRFRDVDASAAWHELTDSDNPAIWFLLLPLDQLGGDGEGMRPEDLYIKMNSRGKPLTEFENFKAHFEKTIEWSDRAGEFALKVDTCWSDMLWHLRGDDGVIDDEFLRYLQFVTEICEWREGRTDGQNRRLDVRTRDAFGEQGPNAAANLEFLFNALDAWTDEESLSVFNRFFGAADGPDVEVLRVPLFFRTTDTQETPDLFATCCRLYDKGYGTNRSFSLGQTLILYAVLLHVIEGTEDFPRRARVLRNLIEASSDELRPDRMPKILADAESVVRSGDLEAVASLNQAQVEDERLKVAFLVSNSELRSAVAALEDQYLLRGSLAAFELDATQFEQRAVLFDHLMAHTEHWADLIASLIAVGEYQRQRANSRPFLFGTDSKRNDGAWRTLLTGAKRDALRQTRLVLGEFLDLVADSPQSSLDAMCAIAAEYLARCDADGQFDWRYYMVKYRSMRGDGSNIYFSEPVGGAPTRMGYSLCMLRAGKVSLSSYYRDPYLLAITHELEDRNVVEDKWFSGYETDARRLPLTRSGVTIRCVPEGFELNSPAGADEYDALAMVRAELGATNEGLVKLPQVEVDGLLVDTVDRVQVGADIVRSLVAAGL